MGPLGPPSPATRPQTRNPTPIAAAPGAPALKENGVRFYDDVVKTRLYLSIASERRSASNPWTPSSRWPCSALGGHCPAPTPPKNEPAEVRCPI